MNKHRFYRFGILIILALFLLSPMACNKSDDDDDDSGSEQDDDDDFTPSSITFTPDNSEGAGEIRLELKSTTPEQSTFVLNVIGDTINQAYGVAGRLEFDIEITTLQSAMAGVALEGNDATIKGLGTGNDAGGIFGFSRSVDYTHSADLSADKPIGTLTFTVTAPGETKIAFAEDRNTVMNHDLNPVEVDRWLGGTLKVE